MSNENEDALTPVDVLLGGGSIDDYMAVHQRQHFCCNCPQQTPPLPCCNPGHDAAQGSPVADLLEGS